MMMRGLLIFVILLIFTGGLYAADIAGGERNDQPIQIKSTELTTDSAKRTATFVGKVSARQGDVNIYCDRMIIFYSDKDKDVEKVEAFGNVRIIQGGRTAQAGHAVYHNKAAKIILTENPKVYEGKNIVAGMEITYYLDSQSSKVISAPGERVMVIIYPGEKRKDGSAKR